MVLVAWSNGRAVPCLSLGSFCSRVRKIFKHEALHVELSQFLVCAQYFTMIPEMTYENSLLSYLSPPQGTFSTITILAVLPSTVGEPCEPAGLDLRLFGRHCQKNTATKVKVAAQVPLFELIQAFSSPCMQSQCKTSQHNSSLNHNKHLSTC